MAAHALVKRREDYDAIRQDGLSDEMKRGRERECRDEPIANWAPACISLRRRERGESGLAIWMANRGGQINGEREFCGTGAGTQERMGRCRDTR